ncbi:MAG: GerMN domain-containing protein [Acidobacteriota bacterium]
MPFKRVSHVLACLVIFLFAAVCVGQGTAKGMTSKSRQVKVYFYHDPGEYIDIGPVVRSVNSRAPARAAVQALLNGPTAAEKKQGFDSLVDARKFSIGSLSIKSGVARVNFVTRRWFGWAGDLGAARFKKAVELTLKQFENVTSVVVSLNGDAKFDDEG